MTEPVVSKGPSWVGCLIPITAVVVLAGLGTCTALTGWMQNRAIAGFTEEQPRLFGREVVLLSDAGSKALDAKLIGIVAAAREGRRVRVPFAVDELNHLLHTQPLLESLMDSTRVVRIGGGGVELESSQPMRKLGGGMRFLNGVYLFRPVASGTNAWQLQLEGLQVPGKPVPEGFLQMARELRLFRFDLDAKELQEVLWQVDSMELEEGAVVVQTREGKNPAPPPERRSRNR